MRALAWVLAVVAGCGGVRAQWVMQESHSTADLRGIANVGGGVAWASGSKGTVLRTVDGGATWQTCAVPDGDKDGATLDFRGVQAFDAKTAIVMSSGKGDLSRLYKTVDGCGTWTLVFRNPDAEGFWDAVVGCCDRDVQPHHPDLRYDVVTFKGGIIGDPVGGRFVTFSFRSTDAVRYPSGPIDFPPHILRETKIMARQGEALFAASNSVLLSPRAFVTGGAAGARFHMECRYLNRLDFESRKTVDVALPVGMGTESSGVFSIAKYVRKDYSANPCMRSSLVAVGGDYKLPDNDRRTAAFSIDGGFHWSSPSTSPHGYRSAVAYDEVARAWLTVGPNGTDVSTDDGRSWRALRPGPGDAVDADQHWNALSLPFVVGPKGRIGVLRDGVLGAVKAVTPGPKAPFFHFAYETPS